ncbi:MAG: helix-turn-helix domain-containing protein [Pseudomonadota bacterium]
MSKADRCLEDVFLTTKELAQLLRVREQTVRCWRLRGGDSGPPYVRVGNGLKSPVIYRLRDVEEWINARTYRSTAEEEQ